jgi:hypothetical protein
MYEPKREICGSLEELEARKNHAVAEGKRFFPCDDPETGEVGYKVFRVWGDTPGPMSKDFDEEAVHFFYCLFGRSLKPNEEVVQDPDVFGRMRASHEDHDTFLLCQWPIGRQVGFICYCEARNGMSRAVKVPLTAFKDPENSIFSKELLEDCRKAQGFWLERESIKRVITSVSKSPSSL